MKSLRVSLCLTLLCVAATSGFAQWIPVPGPTQSDQIEVYHAGSSLLFAGTLLGEVYSSADHGSTWAHVGGDLTGDYAPIVDLFQDGDWLVVSRSVGTPANLRSHFDGSQWSAWEPIQYQSEILRSMLAVGQSLFAVGGGLIRSDDHGLTWSPVNVPVSFFQIFTHQGILFGCQQQTNGGLIYRSSDLGQTWAPTPSIGSSFVCSHAYWQGRLLVCFYLMGGIGTVWSSTSLGAQWEPVSTMPTNRNLNGMAIGQDGRLAVGASGTDSGNESIWLSGDLVHWVGYTGDLPTFARPVNDLLAHDGWFFKTGGSVTSYRAPQPAASAVDPNLRPDSPLALTVRPNPARIETTLRFELSHPANVDLAIYDLTGARIATLAHGLLAVGTHGADWQARDEAGRPFAAGVYFARLRAGDSNQEVKIVLTP